MLKVYFKSKYKELLSVFADKAVKIAEKTGENGYMKKAAAIKYIMSLLPLNPLFKPLALFFLNEIADEAVEFAVRKFNQKSL